MTRRPAAAQVINLAEARDERSVEWLSDGRRKGDHGNRMAPAMRARILADLEETLEQFGTVTVADKKACADAAGVHLRTVNRVWERRNNDILGSQRAADTPAGHGAAGDDTRDTELSGCVEACVDDDHARGCRAGLDLAAMPSWMVKFNEHGRKLQLTQTEVAFFASFSITKHAIDAVKNIPGHRLRHYSDATIYKAWQNVSEPIRVGAKYNATRQRAVEATWPLSGRDVVNDSWSIDEYDLKVVAKLRGHDVHPKMLVVRERFSGLPLARLILHRAANATDTAKVLAAAAIGYTVAGYYPDGSDLRVSGVARYLNADQGSPFVGTDGITAARKLGISPDPSPSNQPQANGDHEVMHQTVLRFFADGPGWRRGWADRADQRLDHGTPPFEAILEAADQCFAELINAPITKGPHKGISRLDAYAKGLDDGLVYTGPVLTVEDEAALSQLVGTRKYDPTRGVELGGRYFLSDDLGNRARKGQLLHIHQLVDPDVIYVFDAHGKFIASAGPREDAPAAEQHGLLADRAAREAFVHKAAVARAARAQAEAVDAGAAWDDIAEKLSDAEAAAGSSSSPSSPAHPAPHPAPDAAAHHAADAGGGERDVLEVVRTTTGRRRRPAAPGDDVAALEAEEEARAARLEAARRTTTNQHPTGRPATPPTPDNTQD